MNKICKKCVIEQSASCFRKNRKVCKLCENIYNKEYRKNNLSRILERDKKIAQKRRQENPEKVRAIDKKSKLKNNEKVKIRKHNYYINNKDDIQEYQNNNRKKRRKHNPSFRLREIIPIIIRSSLKKSNSSKYGKSVAKYLSYTFQELKDHLQSQFEPWMSWNNWGKYDHTTWNDHNTLTWYWQIDHIIPQSKLLYNSMEDDNFKKCWSLENLRPYSAKLNIIEGNRR